MVDIPTFLQFVCGNELTLINIIVTSGYYGRSYIRQQL